MTKRQYLPLNEEQKKAIERRKARYKVRVLKAVVYDPKTGAFEVEAEDDN